ncbi:FAD binding domain-containing protein [Geotalea toluenoxydans]|uniref:FAD binding domain-containing protein n=1 Tax=Geotalea toluenoxydans TaxID=421624 RepID=UPI000B33DA35|nr:FAD binding domain-containing protein [Geotalea toluenoxydans]
MYMPDFAYHAPQNLDEACTLLAELGSKAIVLAGGTDVLHKMKVGKLAPENLVSLKHLDDLRTIRHEPGRGIVIGALTSHNAIYTSKLLQERFLSLPMAAHTMASNQICNMGTVGGNIVNGVPSADLPPILIALNASIRLVSVKGERTMPLEDFFHGAAETVIAPGELLADITIPDQPTTGSTYMKFACAAPALGRCGGCRLGQGCRRHPGGRTGRPGLCSSYRHAGQGSGRLPAGQKNKRRPVG